MTITLNAAYATFAAGASVDLDNATEAALVAQGRAVYTSNPGSVFAPLTAAEQQMLRKNAPATQALVTGTSISRMVAAATPNLTLLDTGASAGTTMTQIGMMTIPGGAMGPTSRLLLHAALSGTGGNAKTTTVRAGPASGTFATATSFSGQSGLSNQLWFPLSPMIWNNGTLAAQRATPVNLPTYLVQGSNTTPVVTLAIDTALDWNIYFGVQLGILNGGDSITLHQMYAQQIN